MYQAPVKADAIVFLGQSVNTERIDYAFELAEKGLSERLFSPGGESPNRYAYVERKFRECTKPVSLEKGRRANSTYEEALSTRAFAGSKGLKAILLVTSPSHSYRAHWIFRRMMPSGVHVISTPVPLDRSWFRPAKARKGNAYHLRFRSEKAKMVLCHLLHNWRMPQGPGR